MVLLFLGSLVGLIPMSCLAGALIVVAYNMSGWITIVSMCRQSRSDIAVLFATLLLTVIFDLTIAIAIGLVMAVILFIKRVMENTSISVIEYEIDVHHDGEQDEKLVIPALTEVYEIEGPFFFGIANKFEELSHRRTDNIIRIIRMRKVSFIDATGIHNLEIFIKSAQDEGHVIILSGVNQNVHADIKQAGIVDMVGEENVLDHIHKALARAEAVSSQIKKEA